MYQLQPEPKHRQPLAPPQARPSEDEAMTDLNTVVGASLRTHLEQLSLTAGEEAEVVDGRFTCCLAYLQTNSHK